MFRREPPQRKIMVAKSGPENVEVDETLNALERARHFGNSKLSLQRLVYVNELVDCAHEIGYEATVAHLLPLVKKLASDSEVLVRQSLLGHFGDLAGFLIQSDPERGYQKVVDDLLPVVSALLTEKQGEVRQGAADALTTLASHLRPGERGDQVLMTVISLSHNNDDEDARSTAVQLLNSLAEALGRDLCQQFVGVELVALCEDPAVRVRKATASNFGEVSRVVGDDYVLRRLLPAFKRLVGDAHWGVRKAAAESLVGLAMSLKAERRQEPFVPLMSSLLSDNSRLVRMAAVQQLGYFIASLEAGDRVPVTLLTQYVEIIEQTKANPDAADISYHSAYTFAAVAKTMGKAHWPSLQAPFTSLSRDTQSKTRKAMAASAHIVAHAVGPELTELEVIPQFEVHLQDASHEVRLAALRNVASVLRAAPREMSHRSIAKALQGTMAAKADNWRARHLVASQLGAICEALGALPGLSSGSAGDFPLPTSSAGTGAYGGPQEQPPHAKDIVWKAIVPLFLQLCNDGVAEVRDEAARATARVLRAAAAEMFADPGACGTGEGSGGFSLQRLPPQTTSLVRHIKSFATGRCFRSRMTYIRMCDSIVRETPTQIFTDLFLWPLVRLTADPVKNVRLCWAATMVPHIRKSGRLGQVSALIAAASRMAKTDDKDEEVRRVLHSAQFAELPEDAGPGLEDFDESDKSDSLLATEGGTGDVSEHSDVGVEEPEEEFMEAAAPTNTAASASMASAPYPVVLVLPPGDSTGASSEELPFHPPARAAPGAVAAAHVEGAAPAPTSPGATASTSSTSPVGGRVSPTLRPASVPRSAELISPTAAPSRDLLEDSLVEQCEIDRDMDAAFADRRLLQETSAEELELEVHPTVPPSPELPEAALPEAVMPEVAGSPEAAALPEPVAAPEPTAAPEAAPLPAVEPPLADAPVVEAVPAREAAAVPEAALASEARPAPEPAPAAPVPEASPAAEIPAAAEASPASEAPQEPEVAAAPEAVLVVDAAPAPVAAAVSEAAPVPATETASAAPLEAGSSAPTLELPAPVPTAIDAAAVVEVAPPSAAAPVVEAAPAHDVAAVTESTLAAPVPEASPGAEIAAAPEASPASEVPQETAVAAAPEAALVAEAAPAPVAAVASEVAPMPAMEATSTAPPEAGSPVPTLEPPAPAPTAIDAATMVEAPPAAAASEAPPTTEAVAALAQSDAHRSSIGAEEQAAPAAATSEAPPAVDGVAAPAQLDALRGSTRAEEQSCSGQPLEASSDATGK